MKESLKGFVACAIALMVVAGMVSLAEAGGNINWKTRVTNSSDGDAIVDFYYGVGSGMSKSHTIPKGYSYTFETGKECPTQLQGRMIIAGVYIITKCMNHECGVVCADSEWTIRKHSDSQYFFKKD